MAVDPRSFTVKVCQGKSGVTPNTNQKNFFSAINKVGDLEVLNDIHAGKFGKGLRDLATLGNVISSGTGQLPSSVGSSLEQGGNFVLGTLGIDQGAAQAAASFNPGVANGAYAAAKNMFSSIKNGQVSDISDIASYASNIKSLDILINGIYTPTTEQKSIQVCDPSPYAMDLIDKHPKFKFLFVVQFVFNAGYKGISDYNFAFVVRETDRPTVKFEYDEINMYNFRTKVIKRAIYNPISMKFYDDNENNIMDFYNEYLKAMSPIANLSGLQTNDYENNGMSFDKIGSESVKSGVITNSYSASVGPLSNGQTNILSEIRLIHVYNAGNEMNIYTFFNPKIEELQLDNLSMSENAGTEISLQFTYDGMFLDSGRSVRDSTDVNLTELTSGGMYPLSPKFTT